MTFTILFVSLCIGALFLRPSIALACLILLSHMDAGSSGQSAASVGSINTVKSVIIPLLVLGRLRSINIAIPSRLGAWWGGLIMYAAIASIWSPFLLSAAKMVVYLACYPLFFYLIRVGWEKKWITVKSLLWILLSAVLLGFVQTSFLGNAFGTLEAGQFTGRFTSFASPQSFAAFFVCGFAIILFSDLPRKLRLPALFITGYVIAATGSRYCFVGALFVLGIYGVIWFRAARFNMRRLVYPAAIICTIVLSISVMATDSNNRISELINGQLFGSASAASEQLQDVITFAWRLRLYDETIARLEQRLEAHDIKRLVFGSGTSSGGDVLSTVDPGVFNMFEENNRAMHDEFLRVAYEWGLVGVVLFLGFLWYLAAYSVDQFRRHNYVPLAILPVVFIGLLIENLLAGASSPAGLGYVMAFSCVSAAHEEEQRQIQRVTGVD